MRKYFYPLSIVVVIAIIAILAALLLPSLNKAKEKRSKYNVWEIRNSSGRDFVHILMTIRDIFLHIMKFTTTERQQELLGRKELMSI